MLRELSGLCHVGDFCHDFVGQRLYLCCSGEGTPAKYRRVEICQYCMWGCSQSNRVEVQHSLRTTSECYLETLVCSIWHLLYTFLATRHFTVEVLLTTFCLVEHALNSLLSTSLSADPCNLNNITPNHFLLGEYSTGISSFLGNNHFDHRKRYAGAQSYANAIWSRWIREYVLTLNRRSRWLTPAEQHVNTTDLTWIVEETNPRG